MDAPAWYRLDNVGKFYAAEAGSPDQTIFRLTATMADEVDPAALQRALDAAVALFPGFNVSLRSGMFWHYLEPSGARPMVEPEHLPICYSLHTGPKSVLFRVTYYRRRINVEVSHMISDGRGGLEFLKALVGFYATERYGAAPGSACTYAGTEPQKTEDSFSANYDRSLAGATAKPRVFHLNGWKTDGEPTYLELHLSAGAVHQRAKEAGVSVTSLLIAAVICAVRSTMTARDRHRAIHLDVPVDLRSLFGSSTLRNFFGLAFITYTPGTADEPLLAVAAEVQRQLTAGTEPTALKRRMMAMIKLEKNPLLRAAPLFVKDAILGLAAWKTTREVTTTVSSLGRVAMDETAAPFVQGISALTSTAGLNFIVCTHGDDLSLGMSSRFVSLRVARAVVEVLERAGCAGYLNASRDTAALHRSPACSRARERAPEPSVFPPNAFMRKSSGARTVMLLLTVLCMIASGLLGAALGAGAPAVILPCAAIALNWLFVRNMIVHAPDFIRVVERYFLVLLAVGALWFLATGNLFVTTFALPGLCLLGLSFNAVLLIAYRGPFVSGYAKYLLYELVLGLVPAALALAGLTTWPYLAWTAAAAAVALLAALLLLTRKPLAAEMHKLFSLG